MIPFDFKYDLPQTAEEAVKLFLELEADGKKPLYLAGGTEVITLCRRQAINPGALIDIKDIKETLLFEKNDGKLVIGANLALNFIVGENLYPLLSRVIKTIADHTVRNRLTLGGNICGRLPYREALLPFLLTDADIVLAGPSGRRTEKLAAVFDKRLKLEKGELLLQLEVREEMIGLPDWTRRREKHGPVDYPLYHLVSLNNQGKLRFSVSGLCAFPFRSEELERSLNDQDLTIKEKLKSAGDLLPGQIRDDDRGSAAYRKSLFEKDLEQLFSEMEER